MHRPRGPTLTQGDLVARPCTSGRLLQAFRRLQGGERANLVRLEARRSSLDPDVPGIKQQHLRARVHVGQAGHEL